MEMNEEERETAAGGLAFEAEKLGQHYAAGSQCNSFTLDCTQSGAQSKYESRSIAARGVSIHS